MSSHSVSCTCTQHRYAHTHTRLSNTSSRGKGPTTRVRVPSGCSAPRAWRGSGTSGWGRDGGRERGGVQRGRGAGRGRGLWFSCVLRSGGVSPCRVALRLRAPCRSRPGRDVRASACHQCHVAFHTTVIVVTSGIMLEVRDDAPVRGRGHTRVRASGAPGQCAAGL